MDYPRWFSFSKLVICGFLYFLSQPIIGQEDTLVTLNNNTLLGEVKKMEKGVLYMKTDYSDSDFKIKWKRLKRINTKNSFLLSVHPGKRYNGTLQSLSDNIVAIVEAGDTLRILPFKNVVYLREVKSTFLSNFSGELSLGHSFIKAEKSSEFRFRSLFSYQAERWKINAQYNDIRLSKRNTKEVKRMDAALDYQYYLRQNWYTVSEVSLFSNSEQNIDLRTLAIGGIGKLIVQNDRWYWGVQVGATYNNENFKDTSEKEFQNSAEAFIGTELNLFDIKNFGLLMQATTYPSLTEKRRWRLDSSVDLKYKLPLNFFIKTGFALNYDNKPINNAPSSDYIFQTTIGWDFN